MWSFTFLCMRCWRPLSCTICAVVPARFKAKGWEAFGPRSLYVCACLSNTDLNNHHVRLMQVETIRYHCAVTRWAISEGPVQYKRGLETSYTCLKD